MKKKLCLFRCVGYDIVARGLTFTYACTSHLNDFQMNAGTRILTMSILSNRNYFFPRSWNATMLNNKVEIRFMFTVSLKKKCQIKQTEKCHFCKVFFFFCAFETKTRISIKNTRRIFSCATHAKHRMLTRWQQNPAIQRNTENNEPWKTIVDFILICFRFPKAFKRFALSILLSSGFVNCAEYWNNWNVRTRKQNQCMTLSRAIFVCFIRFYFRSFLLLVYLYSSNDNNGTKNKMSAECQTQRQASLSTANSVSVKIVRPLDEFAWWFVFHTDSMMLRSTIKQVYDLSKWNLCLWSKLANVE